MYRFLLISLVFCLLAIPATIFAGQLVDGSGDVVIMDAGTEDIPELVGYLGGEDPVLAENASALLISFGNESIPELIKVFGDDSKVVPALEILTAIADGTAAGPISRLITDEREGVSGRARYALASIGDGSVGPLVLLLDDDEYYEAAINTLKSIRNSSDVSKEAVRGLLATDNKAVRLGVIETLGIWRDDGLLADMPKLMRDSDPDVRATAINSYSLITDGYDVDLVASLLKDPSSKVRVSAATIMSLKPDGFYVEPLIEAYKVEGDGMTRSVLLGALGESGDAAAKEYLLKGIADSDHNVVVSALWYIDEYKMIEAVPEVEKLFRGKNPVIEDTLVVQEALRSLAALGAKADIGLFLQYISNDYPVQTRKLALHMIAATGTSGDKAAIEALNGMLADEKNAEIRELGEQALESLKE
jgi:HEAT repeat protein